MKTEKISIPNMECLHCARNVEEALSDCPGIIAVRTSVVNREVEIDYNGDENLPPIFRKVIQDWGYKTI